jgi:hypothetical protein
MRKSYLFLLIFILTLTACTMQPTQSREVAAEVVADPLPTPFPLSSDGLFLNNPQDFLVQPETVGSAYTADGSGTESPNSRVIELRPDGAAYVEATARRAGWQIQYNRTAEGDSPTYIVNVVNIYDKLEGPQLTLSRDWHADVWNRIDSGELTLLPSIPGLDAEHLVWQTADGTIGVEIVYRNLYIFLTGPTEGADQYDFFANLAKAHVDWIRNGE